MAGVSRNHLFAACVAALMLATSASAETYSFVRITGVGRDGENPDLSGQLFLDVTENGYTQVDFKFTNIVGIASSVTDVYFDDGSLLGIASITDSGEDVAFSQNASPGNLPGGQDLDPPFEATEGFTADSDPPVSHNGVDSSTEWVTITFDLIEGKTFQDTIDAIADESLRVGIHVQAIGDNEGSDSYLGNNTPVPEPTTAFLMVLGLGIVARRKRRTV